MNRAIKTKLDEHDIHGKNDDGIKRKLQALKKLQKHTAGGQSASFADIIVDVGSCYIEDGVLTTVTEPKLEKFPKPIDDSVRVSITKAKVIELGPFQPKAGEAQSAMRLAMLAHLA